MDNPKELLPVTDENGNVTGSIDRKTAHSGSKILHPVVHLHVFNSRGELYLQKRPDWKDIQPGKWDTATGGHVSYGEGIAEGIALHYLVGHAKGNGDEYGKEDAHPLAVKTVLHVIGRTSVEGVCPTLLVQLGQGGLDKGRCGTKEGHHPHPEHGPGTAHEDGGGHTGQIARTDTAGQ